MPEIPNQLLDPEVQPHDDESSDNGVGVSSQPLFVSHQPQQPPYSGQQPMLPEQDWQSQSQMYSPPQYQQPPQYPPHPYQEYAALQQPPPAPQRPPRSPRRLWIIISIVATALLLGGVIIGAFAGIQRQNTTTPAAQPTQQATIQPTPTQAPTEAPQPTPTPQPTQSSAQSEKAYKSSTQATTVTTLDKQGNAYKGNDVHFTSTISDFVKDSDGNTAYSNVDDPNSSSVILIVYPKGTAFEKLNEGDTLEVWGFDAGTVSGTNAFGATIQIVAIDVMYITDQTTGYATH